MTLTYPLIGNYGINRDDFESINPAVTWFNCKRRLLISHQTGEVKYQLDEYFKKKNIPGISWN